MSQDQWLAKRFEADRGRLRKIAYRLLGSPAEADDAVQEVWLRLSRSDPCGIDNLSGWLTTVVARICLDMLRARKSRQEAFEALSDRQAGFEQADHLEQQELIADSVGLALMVVLEKLTPAERVALVLHDVFDVPLKRSRQSSAALQRRQDNSQAERGDACEASPPFPLSNCAGGGKSSWNFSIQFVPAIWMPSWRSSIRMS
jgi:RNA polymerase sigma factor (sigma-70 family)